MTMMVRYAGAFGFSGRVRDGAQSQMMLESNKNRYHEDRTLFFADRKHTGRKEAASRPKTIAEIKKLQKFVKTQQTTPGKSLNASIRSMAQRDESFNEFLRSFKAKNEHKWANIIDATQEEQEEALLAKSPEYRRNEMIMLEEFRRRKNMKQLWELERKHKDKLNPLHATQDEEDKLDDDTQTLYKSTGPERYLEHQEFENYNQSDWTLIFLDSDSVTNVTSLNRVNHRRVLIFIGDGRGKISYGKGKGLDYESAFESAHKSLKANMICLNWDSNFTVPTFLEGRHNDFRIKIWPQAKPNYWGNPTIWQMLLATGFNHCRYACKSRKRDPYALIYAYFAAVTHNMTTQQLELEEGRKLFHSSYGNALTTKQREGRDQEDPWDKQY